MEGTALSTLPISLKCGVGMQYRDDANINNNLKITVLSAHIYQPTTPETKVSPVHLGGLSKFK